MNLEKMPKPNKSMQLATLFPMPLILINVS